MSSARAPIFSFSTIVYFSVISTFLDDVSCRIAIRNQQHVKRNNMYHFDHSHDYDRQHTHYPPFSSSSLLTLVRAGEDTNQYEEGESVTIYANKMGPLNNPLETYAFFELPGCAPAKWEHKRPTLGQAMVGDELFEMHITAKFRQTSSSLSSSSSSDDEGGQEQKRSVVCEYELKNEKDLMQWQLMVTEKYWYQLIADGLPMWASFGKMIRDRSSNANGQTIPTDDVTTHNDTSSSSSSRNKVPAIYTHQHFRFGYNKNQIVFANLTVSNLVPLGLPPQKFLFTYAVEFVEMKNISFDNRFRRYLDDSFFKHRIHWFSLVNSFMLVLFLVGMVMLILSRTLRRDYDRYSSEGGMTMGGLSPGGMGGSGAMEWMGDETPDRGWRLLHHDVMRTPPRYPILCALVGTGVQLIVTLLLITLFAISSVLYASQGATTTYGILIYCFTSSIAGFVSGSMCRHSSSSKQAWIHTMLLTAGLFPGSILIGGFLLNFIAIAYDSAQAIPAEYMLLMLFIWAVSAFLCALGTFLGRHRGKIPLLGSLCAAVTLGSGVGSNKVNQIPRMVPPSPWFVTPTFIILAGGVLPFATIFIELYFVFSSFWNYKFYYVYGFILLVLVILTAVTASVAVVVTYMLLNAEDHRWQWPVFAAGGSVGAYVFLYAIYFHIFKTKMTGFLMFSFYYGYITMLCAAVGILCGSVAYLSASCFIKRIYADIKSD